MVIEAPEAPSTVGPTGRDFWKGIATDISEAQNAADVFRLAPDLDFEVAKSPLSANVMETWVDGGEFHERRGVVPVNGWVATTRTDTNEVLGIVSDNWQNYQNRQLTDFAEALRGEIDAPYQRALVLFGGRVVGLEVKLGEDMFLPGDPSPWHNHAFIWTGHDGRHALNIQRLKQRIFCANQFSTAIHNAIATFKVRHTKNMNVNLKDVFAALNMVAQYDKSFAEAMEGLSRMPVGLTGAMGFSENLLPIPENVKNPVRTENAREAIVNLFESSPTLEGVDYTRYRLFQAVGEYVDHERTYRTPKGGTPADGRAVSIIEGSAQTLKQRAFALLTA